MHGLMAFFCNSELYFSLLCLANPADIPTKELSVGFFRIVRALREAMVWWSVQASAGLSIILIEIDIKKAMMNI